MIGRGTTKAEDAQGTPTQSHISPSMIVYEDKTPKQRARRAPDLIGPARYTSIRRQNTQNRARKAPGRASQKEGQPKVTVVQDKKCTMVQKLTPWVFRSRSIKKVNSDEKQITSGGAV